MKNQIALIGVGSGGVNCLNQIVSDNNDNILTIAVDRTVEMLKRSDAQKHIFLKSPKNDQQKVTQEVCENKSDIVSLVKNLQSVVLVSCLGGFTGSFASGEIARIARELGVHVAAIITEPFNFEGEERTENARLGLEQLKAHCDNVLCLPNQDLFRKGFSLEQALREMDLVVMKLLEETKERSQSITEILNPYSVPLDDADVFKTVCDQELINLLPSNMPCDLDLMQRMQPASVGDICIALALSKRWPIEAGITEAYLGALETKSTKAFLPQLDLLLRDTRGVLIFREQIREIVCLFTLMNDKEAEELLDDMAKKEPDIMLDRINDFILMASNNNVSVELAESVFNYLEKYSGYVESKETSMRDAITLYKLGHMRLYDSVRFSELFLGGRGYEGRS